MTDDYRNEPITIAAARAQKTEDAAAWSPRDALVDVLRRLDSGEYVPAAVVIVTYREEDGAGYTVSSPDKIHTLGMLSCAEFLVLHGKRHL